MRRASPIPSSSSFLVLQVPRCMFNRRVAAAPSDACERDSIRSSPPPPQSSGHGGCLQSAQKRGHHTMQCAKCPYHPSSRRPTYAGSLHSRCISRSARGNCSRTARTGSPLSKETANPLRCKKLVLAKFSARLARRQRREEEDAEEGEDRVGEEEETEEDEEEGGR